MAKEFIHRIPPHSTRIHSKANFINPTVEIDKSLVDSVVINPQAKALLSPDQHFLTAPDTLIALARFSVPPALVAHQDTTQNTLIPRSFGRCLTLAHGQYPIANRLLATFIFGKGGGPSGDWHPSFGNLDQLTPDPIGFFGHRDAHKEIQISNVMLEEGMRSTLPLGYLVFNHKKLKNHLTNFWRQYKYKQSGSVDTNLAILRENGDDPVFLFRLGGTPQRIDDASCKGLKINKPKQNYFMAMIRRSCQIWLAENKLDPSTCQNFTSPENLIEISRSLENISNGNTLTPSTFSHLQEFITIILARENHLFPRVQNKLSHFRNLSHAIFDPKDTDTAMVFTDYEDTISGQSTKSTRRNNQFNAKVRSYFLAETYTRQILMIYPELSDHIKNRSPKDLIAKHLNFANSHI